MGRENSKLLLLCVLKFTQPVRKDVKDDLSAIFPNSQRRFDIKREATG